MTECLAVRQNDEWFCAVCKLRWGIGDTRPECATLGAHIGSAPRLKAPEPEPSEEQLRIAKCIIGPRSERFIGVRTLMKLQDHKWDKQTSGEERVEALDAARAILVVMGR